MMCSRRSHASWIASSGSSGTEHSSGCGRATRQPRLEAQVPKTPLFLEPTRPFAWLIAPHGTVLTALPGLRREACAPMQCMRDDRQKVVKFRTPAEQLSGAICGRHDPRRIAGPSSRELHTNHGPPRA